MKDGLYQVKTRTACAGFTVKNGKIADCAPYLRKVPHDQWHPKRVITHLILVTGSRSFRDRERIRRTLLAILAEWDVPADQVGLLHGGAAGADSLCAEVGEGLGMLVQKMEPDWDLCDPEGIPPCTLGHRKLHKGGLKTFCPTAGYRRNQGMVDRVVAFLARGSGRQAVCVVFRSPGKSNGTDDCTARMKAAKLTIWP